MKVFFCLKFIMNPIVFYFLLISCGPENSLQSNAESEETSFEKAKKALEEASRDDKLEGGGNFCHALYLFDIALAEENKAEPTDHVNLAKVKALMAAVLARLSGLKLTDAVSATAAGELSSPDHFYFAIYPSDSLESIHLCVDDQLGDKISRFNQTKGFLDEQLRLIELALQYLADVDQLVSVFTEDEMRATPIDISLAGTIYSGARTAILYQLVFIDVPDLEDITSDDLANISIDDVDSLITSFSDIASFSDSEETRILAEGIGAFADAIESQEGEDNREKLIKYQQQKNN